MAKSSAPTLVLTLIITMLCLSVGAIVLIIYFNANRPDSAAIAAACKSEVGAAIKTESDRVATQCEEAAKSTVNIVAATDFYPGFTYPSSWTAVGKDFLNAQVLEHWIDVSPGLLYYCTDCDGPAIPVRIVSFEKSTVPSLTTPVSLKTYVESRYTDPTYSNISIKEEKVNGADAVVVTGHSSGLWDTDFENIYVLRDRFIVRVEADMAASYKDGWAKIKSTLDFSKIE